LSQLQVPPPPREQQPLGQPGRLEQQDQHQAQALVPQDLVQVHQLLRTRDPRLWNLKVNAKTKSQNLMCRLIKYE
jgi:hypothetical protein